jgi:hypothetical protein
VVEDRPFAASAPAAQPSQSDKTQLIASTKGFVWFGAVAVSLNATISPSAAQIHSARAPGPQGGATLLISSPSQFLTVLSHG